MMVSWLPIFITIGIIVLPAILIIRYLSSKNGLRKKRTTTLFFSSYFAILVISFVAYLLLPLQSFTLKTVNGNMGEVNKQTDQMYQDLFNGEVEKVDRHMIKDEWVIDYDYTELRIHQSEGAFDGVIIIDRKNENDGVIEGSYYLSIINGGLDLSDEILPIRTNIVGDRLELIGNVATIELEYAFSKTEFVINQFEGSSLFQQQPDSYRDLEVLYLRVPSDLQIINDQELPIHYVGEE